MLRPAQETVSVILTIRHNLGNAVCQSGFSRLHFLINYDRLERKQQQQQKQTR